jgi:hypothetical protein
MYSTCLFCQSPLGANEVIEAFPVGRRLAFDASRGRLWVVCRRCEKWNLSPLEERWEAIEGCERRFRDTRVRVSTDNIGMARLAEGLELVRVGAALRPEFAAWRYGDQFGRRRRATVLKVGLGLGAVGAVVAGGVAAGVGLGGVWWWIYQWSRNIVEGSPEAVVARIPGPGGHPLVVRRMDVAQSHFVETGGSWGLEVQHKGGSHVVRAEEAVRVIGLLLPAVNRYGGSRTQVADAVRLIEDVGSADDFVERVARASSGRWREMFEKQARRRGLGPLHLSREERLALEMAAHEESERRAMEGELAALEAAWRDAEEVAGIADNLFLPSGVDDMLARLRGTRG